ncbi:MAG: hypothetical protein Q9225_007846 [Loekoesia sp. 1 TL-2023]
MPKLTRQHLHSLLPLSLHDEGRYLQLHRARGFADLSNFAVGWWLSEEPERHDGPFLTEPQWDTVLRESGFSGLDGSLQINHDGANVASVLLAGTKSDKTSSIPDITLAIPKRQAEGNLIDSLQSIINDEFGRLSAVEQLMETSLDDKYAIVLAMEDSTWLEMDEKGLLKMRNVFQSARGILWVVRGARSQNPIANMVIGLARSIRPENAGLRFSTLDLDAEILLPDEKAAAAIMQVAKLVFGQEQLRLVADVEFSEIKGILHIPRIIEDRAKDDYIVRETCPPVPEPQPLIQARLLKMKLGQIGLLDSIHFEEDTSVQLPLGKDDIEISIKAADMNFKDVMISLGQIPYYHDLGLECSGIVTAVGPDVSEISIGDSVCGIVKGAYASSVRVYGAVVAKIPPEMPFSHAASIPMVFCTAHYALFDAGRLCKGESILIHAAAGGVGQAAIMLALKAEAEIYVTVSSIEKRALVMETYGIQEDHIFSSRDTSFVNELMNKTDQRGVDLILNSTAGEILQQSWQCLAPLGRFIEIGKRDIVQNSNLEMGKFADSVSFISVDIGTLLEAKSHIVKRLMNEIMDLYQRKAIQTVTPITTLPVSQVGQGMRMMQGGKHMGKIVVEVIEDDVVQVTPGPSPKAIPNPNASYLITGGTGGLGRSITRWLAGQGAKNIILVSRSGMSQKGVPELIEELKALAVNVVAKQCDIADGSQLQSLVNECQQSMPPIRGVIHGAMALRDALFDEISLEEWTLNIAPRVNGAWNLHNCLSRTPLDFFILLASASGITSNPGQAVYAASNTFLDAFAAYRHSLGLPTSTIDIGIVESVGYVAENADRRAEIESVAHERLTENELLALIKAAITNPQSQEWIQTITGCRLIPNKPLPVWATDPKFTHVLHAVQSASTSSSSSSATDSIPVRHLIQTAPSLSSATEVIVEALIQKLSNLLMLPVEDIDRKKLIVAYGLDSLVAIEFRNWISNELEANVPLMELMNCPSIEGLGAKVAGKSRLIEKEGDKGEGKGE